MDKLSFSILRKQLLIIDEIKQILLRFQLLKLDMQAITGDEYKVYRTFKGESGFFGRIHHYLFQIYIIQLCMILNPKKNEHHSLHHLIREIRDCRGLKRKHQNSQALLNEAENRLNALTHLNFPVFKTLRDKFWAHRDSKIEREKAETKVRYSDAWNTLSELQEIYNLTQRAANLIPTYFDAPFDTPRFELADMMKYVKMHKALHPKRFAPETEEEKELINIMMGMPIHQTKTAPPSDDTV